MASGLSEHVWTIKELIEKAGDARNDISCSGIGRRMWLAIASVDAIFAVKQREQRFGIHPAMPRFSIKDMLSATAHIATGIWFLVVMTRHHQRQPGAEEWPELVLLFGGVALLGAGLGTPFGRHWRGAAIAVGSLLALMLPFYLLWLCYGY